MIYAIPILNLPAAVAIARVTEANKKMNAPGMWAKLAKRGVSGLLLATVMACGLFLYVSSRNYPGGTAMSVLHTVIKPENVQLVHIGNLAAQSGVSRFTEAGPPWKYSKKEKLELGDMTNHGFSHLISEYKDVPGFRLLQAVQGFDRIKKAHPRTWLKNALYIHEREGLAPSGK